MTEHAFEGVRRPRMDDSLLNDALLAIPGSLALLVAHDLKLFPLLSDRPLPLPEVCAALGLARRAAQTLLAVSASLGLVRLDAGRYALTPLAEDYLLPTSPTYFGSYLDLFIGNASLYSFENVKRAVLTDSPQVYGGQDMFEAHEEQAARARAFTRAMHSRSLGPALAWPDAVDLSGHRLLLDVGGGSGAHAIGATLRWPGLHAIVLDLGPVCEVAEEFVAAHGLQDRVRTRVGDMWNEPFPAADVHFYSLVYHDWPPDKCRELTRKSFDSLEPGGRLIIHEMLYDDDKSGPFAVAAFSVQMLLWAPGGEQYSGAELSAMLDEAGFTDVEVTPTFGYWSVVTGRKP